MVRHNIQAIALNADQLRHAFRNDEQDIYKEICRCQWSVVIVLPERLVTKSFKDIVSDQVFRKILCLYAVDEAHVIIPWGKSFHQAYGDIGTVCTCIPPDTPVLAMTATLWQDLIKPLLWLLSFHSDELRNIIQQSCKKPNLQLVFQTLTHGLGGNQFSDISTCRKSVSIQPWHEMVSKTVFNLSSVETL